MFTEKFTDKEMDIIHEALTMYAEACHEGSYEYTGEEVDALTERFE